MDHRILLQQIGAGNLMACGARDFVLDGASLIFRVGSSRKLRKLVVTLTPADDYTVRFVELSRKTYEVTADETVDGVYCDNIGDVVRRLGDRP